MRFCTATLGCKANQYDTGITEAALCSRGHEQVSPGSGCDVCIINTCAVTAGSVRKSKQAIRRMKKLEPAALIAVCGCFAQLDNGAAAALGADITAGSADRETFADKVEALFNTKNKNITHSTPDSQLRRPVQRDVTPDSTRTRALLKIQDGCGNRCAYCIIPQTRGTPRSMPLAQIAVKARELEAQGYKEIVLTGIEISEYKPSLIEALQAVSSCAPNARIRIGSLDPVILSKDYIEQMREIPNLCDHFHISLQSGCDATLRRMKRAYDANKVLQAIGSLRGVYPECGVTADLIAGFPGESEEEFGQTLEFIKKAAFSAMHIFQYSKRPGTEAAGMPGQIPGNIKRGRAQIAAQTAQQLAERFKNAQTGKTLEVLFETYKGKHSTGYSRNYLKTAVIGKIPKNTVKNVKILGINDGTLYGEIV